MELITVILILAAAGTGIAAGYMAGNSRLSRLEERNLSVSEQHLAAEEQLTQETRRANEAEKRVAELQADFRNLEQRLEEQKLEFVKMEEQFHTRFENLANRILEEKSKKFTEQNREKLDELLKPLGEKIEEFRKRVEQGQKEDIKGRSALEQNLKTLQDLNQNMAEEAKNLTRALKGDSKRQGNWGEVILQRILERSGLQKGREYTVQQSFITDDGRRLQPDIIVNLPDDKHLVIDSKVSLTAYERFNSADEEEVQNQALKEHLVSLRKHVKDLSAKNYQQLCNRSPDFILLFVPIEPAFGYAMQNDENLYNEAFDRNIIIVSPTTLLATLATIENVWKQEYQNKNALEIASRGGALYDKFVLFVESLKDVGQRIEQTRKSYDEAMTRLSTGSGNLVRQVEMLRELGAKTSKQLPGEYSDGDYRNSDPEAHVVGEGVNGSGEGRQP
ncbi:MAG: DNA recombination protein RmuC [Balneolaceae bacterium]